MLTLHRINKFLPTLVFLNICKRYQKKSALLKIEVAKGYVLGIQKIRFFLLGTLFVLFSLTIFASGLLLIHTALFTYSAWTVQVKFLAAILLGCFEIFAASGMLFYLFREKTWIRFSGISHVIDSVVKKEEQTLSSSTQSR